jgi:hypothetical protein
MLGQDLLVVTRGVLGRFKRSSQHLNRGSCDEYWEAAFGSGRARRVRVIGAALGRAA